MDASARLRLRLSSRRLSVNSSPVTGGVVGSVEAVGGALTTGTPNGAAICGSLSPRIACLCDLRRKRIVRNRVPPTNKRPVAVTSESPTRLGVELPARVDGCSTARAPLTAGSMVTCAPSDGCRKVTVGMLRGTRYFVAPSSVGAAACVTAVWIRMVSLESCQDAGADKKVMH
jgi:hypothetical protein